MHTELQRLKKQFFEGQRYGEGVQLPRRPIGVLRRLTGSSRRCRQAGKNILDYADLQNTLRLRNSCGKKTNAQIADRCGAELSEQISKIMIGEYRDLYRRHCFLCSVRRRADGTGLWLAISSRASTIPPGAAGAVSGKNIIRPSRRRNDEENHGNSEAAAEGETL